MAFLQNPTVLSGLRMYGIIGTGLAAGSNFSLSLVSIPAILAVPSSATLLARQWETIFDRAAPPTIALHLSSALAFGALAFHARDTFVSRLYGVAAVAAASVVPYTRALMAGTNAELKKWAKPEKVRELAEGQEDREKDEVRGLVQRWGSFNFYRAFLPLIAVALTSYVGEIERS